MWAKAHPTKFVLRTREDERLARFREDKCQGAEDYPGELVRKFISAFKVLNRGCKPVEEVSRGVRGHVGSAHGLSRPTRVS